MDIAYKSESKSLDIHIAENTSGIYVRVIKIKSDQSMIYIQGVTGGRDKTSGGCSLC
jgi:hypothetical protein